MAKKSKPKSTKKAKKSDSKNGAASDTQPQTLNLHESDTGAVEIDVISDVMCPWCYIGMKHLETGVKMAGGIAVDIRWRPFLLDPTIPPEGKDRQQYLADKFGDKADEIYARVEEAGKAAGIEFNFSAITISPRTIDAHRLLKWAGGISSQTQNFLAKRLFELFFLEGANVGDHGVLITAGLEAGMDQKILADLLPTDKDIEAVIDEIRQAQTMGITGVPCFIVGRKYAVMGAQPPETIADAIRAVAAERAEQMQS